MKKLFSGIFVLLAMFTTGIALTACNNGVEASITVSQKEVTLNVGESIALEYYTNPSSLVIQTEIVGEDIFERSVKNGVLTITALENEECSEETKTSILILKASGYSETCAVSIEVTVIYPENEFSNEELPEEDKNEDLDEEKDIQNVGDVDNKEAKEGSDEDLTDDDNEEDNEENSNNIVDGSLYYNLTSNCTITGNTILISTNAVSLSFGTENGNPSISTIEITATVGDNQIEVTPMLGNSFALIFTDISEFAGSEGVLTVYFTIEGIDETLIAMYKLIFE